jgi:transcriptional regulator with XRE-family HTH domain
MMTGEQLKERRENLKFSQTKMAELLGTTQNTIYRWETNRMKIQNPEMLDLALKTLERELKTEKPQRATEKI